MISIILLGTAIIIISHRLYKTSIGFRDFKKDCYKTIGTILKRLDKIESQKYLVKEKEGD